MSVPSVGDFICTCERLGTTDERTDGCRLRNRALQPIGQGKILRVLFGRRGLARRSWQHHRSVTTILPAFGRMTVRSDMQVWPDLQNVRNMVNTGAAHDPERRRLFERIANSDCIQDGASDARDRYRAESSGHSRRPGAADQPDANPQMQISGWSLTLCARWTPRPLAVESNPALPTNLGASMPAMLFKRMERAPQDLNGRGRFTAAQFSRTQSKR